MQRVGVEDVAPHLHKLREDQPFRTRHEIKDTASSQQDEAQGLGARNLAGRPMRTRITFHPVDGQSQEGTRVQAHVLGPDHTLGASPDRDRLAIWNRRRDAFNHHFADTHIAGHLLNDHLGGPGSDARNLTTISSRANTKMEEVVEQTCKRQVNNQHRWIHFEARVHYSTLSSPAVGRSARTVPDHLKTYASRLDFTWGPLGNDERPTGDVSRRSLAIADPSTGNRTMRKPVASDLVTTATGNAAEQAETRLAIDEFVLKDDTYMQAELERIRSQEPELRRMREEIARGRAREAELEEQNRRQQEELARRLRNEGEVRNLIASFMPELADLRRFLAAQGTQEKKRKREGEEEATGAESSTKKRKTEPPTGGGTVPTGAGTPPTVNAAARLAALTQQYVRLTALFPPPSST